jgi:SAM-dependent methyltransferase
MNAGSDPLQTSEGAGKQTLELLETAARYNRWVFDRVSGALGRRVLEIGCGTGTITQFLVDRDLVVGVDVVARYVEASRARYRGCPNVVIQRLDVASSIEELAPYRFDSAVSVNVFEHIADDLAAMRAVHSLLEPGGTLTLLVPGHPSLMSPFDRSIGHHRRYTKRELHDKLEAAGFRVDRIRRTNPVGALGWFVNNTLLRRRELAGVGLYDRLVPLLARVDRAIEPPVGLSLVAVSSKVGLA